MIRALLKIDKMFWLALLILFLGLPFIGKVHLFDWDEINFAEIAREMIVTKNYVRTQINFQNFLEKPPLYFWLQACSMSVFGINEFAARFPNFICGILSLVLIYGVGVCVRSKKFAGLWALVYISSLLPGLYFQSGIIDPWFNLFIMASIYFYWLYLTKETPKLYSLSALCMGFALLTKGPACFLLFGLSFVFFINQKKMLKSMPIWFLMSLLPALAWFVAVLVFEGKEFGLSFIRGFFDRQVALFTTADAGHGGFFGYHFIVLALGCFPASVFIFGKKDQDTSGFKKLNWVLLGVVLFVFTIVRSKIVHYSSLAYFPITFLATQSLYEQDIRGKSKWILLWTLGLGVSLVPLALSFLLLSPKTLDLLHLDPFTKANLEAPTGFSGAEAIVGVMMVGVLCVFTVFRFKKGAIQGLFLSFGLLFHLLLMVFVPKIEALSQGAAIQMVQNVKDQSVYLNTFEYRSYVPLFYGGILPEGALKIGNGSPQYLICKNIKQNELIKRYPNAKWISSLRGFTLFKVDLNK